MQDKQYKQQAEENRGKNIERLAHKLLSTVFGDNAYHSVKIKKGKQVVTDVDGLVVVGNKAIVFQEKSKWLTDLAKSGNDDSLIDDFKKAIQTAYNQGLVSRNSILQQEGLVFELEDGTIIKPSETIDEVYVVCVTSSVYPAAITQVDNYLEKNAEDPSTMAISLLDLDVFIHYLRDPYEFLYYIKQRIDMHDHITAAGEIALLGFHLNQRLYRMKENEHLFADQSWAQLIDVDLMYRVGIGPKPAAQHQLHPQSRNEIFERILAELKAIEQPQITDVIIFLMGMSQEAIDEFMGYIQQRYEDVKNGKKDTEDFSATMTLQMGGFTYVVSNNHEKMAKVMNLLAIKNKYLHKEDRWVALGSFTGSGNLISAVQYIDEPWHQSDDLDELLRKLPPELSDIKKLNYAHRKGTTKKKAKRKKRPPKRKRKKN
jgi:hypothetical protein